MFFSVSKILAPLSAPLTYIALLMFVALVFYRYARIGKICLIGALFLLFVFGTSPVPNLMMQMLETQYTSNEPLPHVNAVIVLSGALDLRKSSSDYLEFGPGVERILEGIRLFKEGYGDVLLISGGSGDLYDQTKSEAILLRQFAIDLGVPEHSILIEPDSRNTYENAVNTKILMEQQGFSTSILVTTASHLPRAMGCFKKAGLEPLPYPVDFHSDPNPEYHLLDFLPDVGSFVQTSISIHEYLGILAYKLTGYI